MTIFEKQGGIMGLFPFIFALIVGLTGPRNVKVLDKPNDDGSAVIIEWDSASVTPAVKMISIYKIPEEMWGHGSIKVVDLLSRNTFRYVDTQVKPGKRYYYYVRFWGEGDYIDSKIVGPVVPKAEWFHKERLPMLVVLLIYGGLLAYFLKRIKKGEEVYIRPIAGLQAIDDAVGRSTEMGQPVLFILGLGYINDIATLAALSILQRVAKKTAEYESELIVPCFDPVVMTAAQEMVRSGCFEAGRPDLYNQKKVFFLTNDQFGYAAGVDGIMMRERPGAIFLMGLFFAESLILAETGHSVGAIQISGTTSITQLPFFIAATDYTLIGEEMYAASAYLSKDLHQLSTIKAEDMMKGIILATITIGVVLETVLTLLGKPIPNYIKQFLEGGLWK